MAMNCNWLICVFNFISVYSYYFKTRTTVLDMTKVKETKTNSRNAIRETTTSIFQIKNVQFSIQFRLNDVFVG